MSGAGPGHSPFDHVTPEHAGPDAIGPTSAPPPGQEVGRGPDLAVGVAVLLMALLVVWQTLVIPASPTYAVVGPTVVPWLVAALLVGVGAGLCGAALRGGWSKDLEEVREAPPTNWRALGLLAAGLIVQVALIEWLGFVIASTILYVFVCAAFGSRRPLVDLLIGIIVTVVAYLAFDRLLGVNIGAGILEGIL
ncbi:tripartite tricarboxylate transporter TctB family protein [Roseomonas sp. OT10]|uniref:tripartite tricarboxylate transporter TctB family protein n=1 Tax=Roseomonas cutis TaxID=2897332 RepID=UPI001E52F362|nr:tripartite tricarboxylate transporter TctB family protein [Roseomonas sp. OT10]UFN48986.1 tripartite tricarboxylate transporter TctB family protein [Roseomonas sp. OT10]